MREIKFRMWLQKSKLMKLVDSSLEQLCFEDGHYYEWNGTDEKPIFLQFTGLKDENGREIYEGDICLNIGFDGKPNGTQKIVEWSTYNNVGAGFNHRDDGRYLQVIGNIYEHPELIKN